MKLETKVKRVNAKLDKLNAELKHIQDVDKMVVAKDQELMAV